MVDCIDHGYKGGKYGYSNVVYQGKYIGRHVVALIEHSGEMPNGRVAMHSCDNPRCIEPTHLSWGTQKDNMRDKANKGRSNVPKLVDVDKAKGMRQDGHTLQEIADVFGVSRQAVFLALKA